MSKLSFQTIALTAVITQESAVHIANMHTPMFHGRPAVTRRASTTRKKEMKFAIGTRG